MRNHQVGYFAHDQRQLNVLPFEHAPQCFWQLFLKQERYMKKIKLFTVLMRCSQRLQTVHMKRIFFYIKAYIPHALDLLNQSDKIFTNIEEQRKIISVQFV